MKLLITTILFTSLLFSAKISPTAEMEKEPGLPLLVAIYENKSFEKIKSLVENNASVDEKCSHGKSALMVASEKNRLDVVKFLFEKNANVNDINQDGHSALCYADNPSEVKKFLEKNGATPHC